MLRWALIFFAIALSSALFGYGGAAGASAGIAKMLFIGFVVVAAVVLVLGLGRGGAVLSNRIKREP